MTECKPKIVSYFVDCGNLDFKYNCELCDNTDCPIWKEFNENKGVKNGRN